MRSSGGSSTNGSAELVGDLGSPGGPLLLRLPQEPIQHEPGPKAATEGVECDRGQLLAREAQPGCASGELVGEVGVRYHAIIGRAGDADAEPMEARQWMLCQVRDDAG